MELMQRYLNKGHHLYVDNWYTSLTLLNSYIEIKLVHVILFVKIDTDYPPLSAKLKRSDRQYRHTDILLALKWQDKREVYMLSTIHSTAYENSSKIGRQTGEEIRKPVCILDYTKKMRVVDHVENASSVHRMKFAVIHDTFVFIATHLYALLIASKTTIQRWTTNDWLRLKYSYFYRIEMIFKNFIKRTEFQ